MAFLFFASIGQLDKGETHAYGRFPVEGRLHWPKPLAY